MMPRKYSHLFFDLDHTLWDFEANSLDTLREIYARVQQSHPLIGPFETFSDTYHTLNSALWELYRNGEIEKKLLNFRRFHDSLAAMGVVDEALAEEVCTYYVEVSPTKKKLYPGTREVLEQLKPRYRMHIITNGFPEVQYRKLDISGLREFFTEVIVSEEVGANKPSPEIFHIALKWAGALPGNSVMIGDDCLVDLSGARAVGMDQIWLDHGGQKTCEVTYQIRSIEELLEIV